MERPRRELAVVAAEVTILPLMEELAELAVAVTASMLLIKLVIMQL